MKKSIVLLVVTLVAVAYVWYFEVRRESRIKSTDEAVAASKTLTGLQKEDITGFTLEKASSPAISVRKAAEAWELTAPVKASAEDGAINSILWNLVGVEKDATIPPQDLTPEKLTAFGLDKPRGSIDITSSTPNGASQTTHFIVGGPDIEGSRIYVRGGNDGPVYLVAKNLADNLNKTVFELRNKAIISLAPAQVGSVTLFGPTKATLEKEGSLWNLTKPFRDYTDPTTVQALLKDAAALAVVSFVSEDASTFPQYGLDKPDRYVVVAEGVTGKRTTVDFGKDAPAGADGEKLVYACVEGGNSVFTVKADAIAKLFVPIPDLQAKTLVRMDPFMVKQINLASGLNEVELKRPDYDWRISKPYEADASSDAVTKVLDAFTSARYNSFISAEPDDAKYGFDKPQGSFSYVQADKAPVGIVFGTDAGDGFVYAKRTDTPGVYKASGSLLSVLKTPTIMLHALEMEKVNVAKLDTMTIAREDRTYVIKHSGEGYGEGSWQLLSPVAASANNEMMTNVSTALAVTRAVEIVEEKATDLAKYGLDKPAIKVSFKMLAGSPQPNALLVGKALQGGKRYAMIEGSPLVFTINAGFARSLRDEARDPRVLAFKVADAATIEYRKGEAKYVLKKVAAGWVLQEPESSTVDQMTVTAELDRLAALQTTEFVDFATAKLSQYGLDNPQAVVRVVLPSSVAALSVGKMADSGYYYATSTTVDGIFLLTPGDVSSVLAPERIARAKPAEETAAGQAEGSQAAEVESTAAQAAPMTSGEVAPSVMIAPAVESSAAPQATGEGVPQSATEGAPTAPQ